MTLFFSFLINRNVHKWILIFRDLIPYLFYLDDLIHNQKLCAFWGKGFNRWSVYGEGSMSSRRQHIQVEGDSKLLIDSIYNLWLYFYCLEDKIVIERYSRPLDHIVFFCSLMCLDWEANFMVDGLAKLGHATLSPQSNFTWYAPSKTNTAFQKV